MSSPDIEAIPTGGADGSPSGPTPRRSRLRTWIALGAVAVGVGVMVVVFAGRFGMDVTYVESPLIGTKAPSLEMEYIDGSGTLRTDDLLGEVVVINFWASWCPPCRQEHPALISTSKRYEGKGVRFVGVLHQDSPENGMKFLDELGWGENYEYVVGDGTPAAIEYGIYGIPETFIIDANGVIAAKITGIATNASLEAAIQSVLASTTTP